MRADLLHRKVTDFVLWRPRYTDPPPCLIIGQLRPGNPPAFGDEQRFELRPSPTHPDLWERPAADCALVDGAVYHYWFEVSDSTPTREADRRIRCTDPTAWTVDWRLKGSSLSATESGTDRDPATVVQWADGELVPCDPDGERVDWTGDADLEALPPNNRLVLYELPTAWARRGPMEGPEIGVGTFRDITALVAAAAEGGNFADVAALAPGYAHLATLGVNGLELLPPADSWVSREWGYATSNYFAADYDLGFPEGNLSPTASTDLVNLIKACHQQGMRFFADVVMAFATKAPYHTVNYLDFHVQSDTNDPEEYNQGHRREAFGGDLFKYNYWVTGYDPVSGQARSLVPARQLMLAYLDRWMLDFRIDGLRLDSVVNIANWDFVREFKDRARELWHARHTAHGHPIEQANERFLVVGEELAIPTDLVRMHYLDGLWNEHFKHLVRSAILGRNAEQEPTFEWTVRTLIDCRLLGFQDGTQAVNYVTSHDVEGFRNERLYNFLINNGVHETEQRIKLAFVCLLTAVGIPMILAGEEFADQHDLRLVHPEKQVDPVNFDRLADPWRRRLVDYVAQLIRLRTSHDALSVDDTAFMHTDFAEGKRVLAWQRGRPDTGDLIVVVANFSAWGTPDPGSTSAEYVVPGWPATPPGKRWREVTQDRDVPAAWVGREPLYPWEAKVYALVGEHGAAHF